MRFTAEWKKPITEGRMPMLSPFSQIQRRATRETARIRNDLVACLADQIFVAHAAPGSKTEAFCKVVLASDKPLLTLASPYNAGLITLGAKAIQIG